MSGSPLWMALGAIEVYLLLAATLGVQTFNKGYSALAIAGSIFPLLWLAGVFLPAKPDSYYQRCHASKAGPRMSVGKAATQQACYSTWQVGRPSACPHTLTAPQAPQAQQPQELQDAPTVAAIPIPETWSTASPTRMSHDERTHQHLLFLRWLVATGRLEP
jgi:hypothetical protein